MEWIRLDLDSSQA